MDAYNKTRSFDFRVKPFGFVQTAVPDRQMGDRDVLPIAPFEKDLRKAMRLPWVDFNTGDPIRLDWHGGALAGTVGVMRLADYIANYAKHAESKAADRDDNPADEDTIGLLLRLPVRSSHLSRIGKEVDRLDTDEAASLEPDLPIAYDSDDLADTIAYLVRFPQAKVAREIGMSERRWRDIAFGRAKPSAKRVEHIRAVARGNCLRVRESPKRESD
jgi:hypothetical protein